MTLKGPIFKRNKKTLKLVWAVSIFDSPKNNCLQDEKIIWLGTSVEIPRGFKKLTPKKKKEMLHLYFDKHKYGLTKCLLEDKRI